MFHEAATRGWDDDELRQLARMVNGVVRVVGWW
jgi:hypothetical protein